MVHREEKMLILSIIVPFFVMFSIYSNTVIMLLTFCFQLASLIYYYKLNNHCILIQKNKAVVLLIFFLICIALSLRSFNPINCFFSTLLLFFQVFIVLLASNFLKDNELAIRKFYNYFIFIMTLLVIYSLVIYIFGNNVIIMNSDLLIQEFNFLGVRLYQSAIGGDTIGTFNVGSLFNNPNSMSYSALFAFIMLIFSDYNIKKKYLYGIILLIGIYISGSRLCLILPFLILLCKGIFSFIDKKKRRVLLLLALFLLVICFFAFNSNRIFNGINFNGRIERWNVGLNNVSLLGKGFGYDVFLLKEHFHINTSMHNSYISFMVNYGIISFIFFMFIISTYIINFIKSNKKNDYNTCFFLILICILISSFVESTFLTISSFNILFFLSLNLCFNGVNMNN